MAPKLVGRIERRLYGADNLEELDALEAELAPMGWEPMGQTMCPPGCTCGEGPFWSSFVLELPVNKKEMN